LFERIDALVPRYSARRSFLGRRSGSFMPESAPAGTSTWSRPRGREAVHENRPGDRSGPGRAMERHERGATGAVTASSVRV
jgi:hypothetical protein